MDEWTRWLKTSRKKPFSNRSLQDLENAPTTNSEKDHAAAELIEWIQDCITKLDEQRYVLLSQRGESQEKRGGGNSKGRNNSNSNSNNTSLRERIKENKIKKERKRKKKGEFIFVYCLGLFYMDCGKYWGFNGYIY